MKLRSPQSQADKPQPYSELKIGDGRVTFPDPPRGEKPQAQRSAERMSEIGGVSGRTICEAIGWRHSDFVAAIGSGLIGPVWFRKDDGTYVFRKEDADAIIARHRRVE